MKAIIKSLNERPLLCGAICTVIFLVVGIFLWLTVHRGADEAGAGIGKAAGTGMGVITGEAEAVKEKERGEMEGKAEGLSAKDTESRLVGELKLQETGKLDVLVAGVSLDNFHGIGNKYAALYLMKADAVFSVDLGQAVVKWGEDSSWVKISVPQPEVAVYFDESETEKIAEWQKNYFSGSADDGFQAYLNTMKEIEASAPQDLARNESMMQTARDAAEQQIKLLAAGIYGMDVAVTVEFQ